MSTYFLPLATVVLLFGAMASSFNLLLGYGRLFSIAHAAFAGVGAYAVAIAVLEFGWPFPLALASGVAIGALLGFVIGGVALRVADDYLAIATFAFQFVFTVTITNLRGITGGAYGIPGIPTAQIGPVAFDSRLSNLALAGVVLIVTLEATRRLQASPFGLNLRAAGQDEVATRSLGKRTKQSKIAVHTLAAALAALAGGIYAAHVGFILPAMFDIHFSILLLSMVIIGGAGSIVGPLLGAMLMVALPDLLNFVGATTSTVAYVRQIFFGSVLLVVVIVLNRGLLRPRPFRVGTSSAGQAEDGGMLGSPEPVVCVDLAKSFGGIAAVRHISARFEPGEVTGIVGPNGAGKTTLFDLVTGFVDPDEGTVSLDRRRLDGVAPDARARLGLTRSWQNLRLFPQLTVLENVMIGVPLGSAEGLLAAMFRRRRIRQAMADAAAAAVAVLDRVGLAADTERPAADLSYAEQKLLSLARVIAARPTAILLDEPASGLDPATLATVGALVRELAAEGRAVCVVEHNTQALAEMADVMVFLHLGEVLSVGAPAEIMADPELASIYFGVEAR